MRETRTWMAALLAAGLAVAGASADVTYDDNASTNWDVNTTWLPNTGYPGNTLGSNDTANINSNTVTANADLTTLPGAAGLTINVLAGGTLATSLDQSFAGLNLDGGTLYTNDSSRTWSGQINVLSNSILRARSNTTRIFTISGEIKDGPSSTGVLSLSGDGAFVKASYSNDNFSGGWLLTNFGRLSAVGDRSLGTGTATVEAGNTVGVPGSSNFSCGLYIEGPQNYGGGNPAQPLIQVNATGRLRLAIPTAMGTNVTNLDITLNGGALGVSSPGQTQILGGTLTVSADSLIELDGDRDLEISSLVKSSKTLTVQSGGYNRTVKLSNGANDDGGNLTGDLHVMASNLEGVAEGVFGTGNLVAGSPGKRTLGSVANLRGGTIRTSANGVLDSLISVTVDEGGSIAFGSVETKQITVKAGGGVRHVSGMTSYDYTNQIHLAVGAILDTSVNTKTAFTRADIANLAAGDGGFSIYLGQSGTVATAYTFGDDGGTTIWRGLAAANSYASSSGSLTYTGTADEAAGSTAGLNFYAQPNSTLTFGTTAAATTLNPNLVGGKHTVHLNGDGGWVLTNIAGGVDTVEKNGGGMLDLYNTTNPIISTPTVVNVNGGLVRHRAGTNLTNLTLNLNQNSVYSVESGTVVLAAGTINVKAGGGVLTPDGAQPDSWIGSAAVTFEEGSMLAITMQSNITSALPGAGKANYLTRHGNPMSSTKFNVDVILGNNTRLMQLPDWQGFGIPYTGNQEKTSGTGAIRLDVANSATQATIATPYAGAGFTARYQIANQVDFDLDGVSGGAAGKLIIGDTSGTWRSMLQSSGGIYDYNTSSFGDVATTGTVELTVGTNNIGSIDIRSGNLFVDSGGYAGRLGNPNAIRIAQNSTLLIDNDNPTLTGIAWTGGGTVLPGNNYGATGNKLTLDGGSISPGSSAGVFTVDGALTVGATGLTLNIEVVGGSLTPGAAFDQLVIDGLLTGIDNIDLVVDVQGTSGIGAGDKLYILTTTSDLTGLSFKSVSGYNPADVEYGNGYAALTNVPEPATIGLLAAGFLPLVARRRRR